MIDQINEGSVIGRELLKLSGELFDRWKRVRDGTMSKSSFASTMTFQGSFRTRFTATLERGLAYGCAKTRRTCAQLAEREVYLFRFAFSDGVEPTKNAAERATRHGVIWRKQSHGPKSESRAKYLANIWGVVETCRQQGRRVWDFLADCFDATQAGRPLPSLVAPKGQPQTA